MERLLRDLHWKNPHAEQPIVPVLFPFSTEKHQAAFSDFYPIPSLLTLDLGSQSSPKGYQILQFSWAQAS